MTDTQHTIEPLPARGGLRRLRRGSLDLDRRPGDGLLRRRDFTAALDAEIRRAILDDHTLVVAAIRVRPWADDGLDGLDPTPLTDELLTRIRSVSEHARVMVRTGDELVVLVPSIRRRAEGEIVVNDLLETLDLPVPIDGFHHHLDPRVGAALLDSDNPSSDLVLDGADLALRHTDRQQPAMLFLPYHRERRELRAQLTDELRHAVLAGSIGAALQPAFDLQTGALVGVEAFARWQRSDGTPVPPLEFVPLAADLGLDHQLTAQVLRRAGELLAAVESMPTTGYRPIILWLNISAADLLHPGFGPLVSQAVTDHPEITIGIELSPSPDVDDRTIHDALRVVVATGARVAIGDFGVGNASLTVMPHLPFDSVKIDRALVRQISDNAAAATMVEFLAGLASRLELEATAQGVETRDQLRSVAAAGCDIGQGYYFAPPTSNLSAIGRWFHR